MLIILHWRARVEQRHREGNVRLDAMTPDLVDITDAIVEAGRGRGSSTQATRTSTQAGDVPGGGLTKDRHDAAEVVLAAVPTSLGPGRPWRSIGGFPTNRGETT